MRKLHRYRDWLFPCAATFLVALTPAEGESPSYSLTTVPLQPLAVNASGQVVGYASFNGSTVHAALFSNGQLTDLGTLGGDFSEAVAINAAGVAVGDSTLPNGQTHATLWANGEVIDLGTLPTGTTSYATGINDGGQITGWSETVRPNTSSPQPEHAFIYENGQMTDLGNISATQQFANTSHGVAINAAGEVTGWSVTDSFETHAFLYSGGKMSDLGTLGGSESRGSALNDAGEVVGWSFLPNDSAAHAFLVSGGPMLDLGTVTGENNSYAVGISGTGAILGNSTSSSGGPFLSIGGSSPVNLNTFIDTFLQVLTRAIAINEGGRILAGGITDNFVENEYLLTPISGNNHHFANISTRLRVGSSEDVLIAGFTISGLEGSTKNVMVRAIGPSLAGLGVADPLADPTLELRDGGNVLLATNDNWKETQQAEIEASHIVPGNDLESAIIRALSPGAYTAVVRGADGGMGVGLAEVYDLEAGSVAQVTNLSTRGQVGLGDNVMIGGVIISGSDPVNLVARAIGPSLGDYGVMDVLLDPVLELHDAEGNVTSNDDWRETQEEELLADHLAPADDRESAIAVTLAPGSYTAIVRGKNNTTGVALIEFYQL